MRGGTASRVAGRATRALAALALVLALAPCTARAQAPASLPPAAEPGSELTVDVITWGQGEALWERFGHNALRIQDARTGTDLAYNWGVFDFAQPNFIWRFLTGDTRYAMEPFETPLMVSFYQRQGRPAVIQRLNLTPAEKLRLQQFVQWNALEENKWYRYDYFLDNCSTRLRDALDRGLDGRLKSAWYGDSTANTFRSEALRLVAAMPFLEQGMDIALGRPADRHMTAWEEAYVPMRLRDRLRAVQVAGPGGQRVPLVESEREIPADNGLREAPAQPNHLARNLVLGIIVGALLVLLGVRASTSRGARIGFATLGAAITLLVGVLGVILLLAWAGTAHHFWYRNENLLLINPVTLPLALLLPLALRHARWQRAAMACAAVGALLSVIAIVFKLLPHNQSNLGVVLLMVPVHLGLLLGLGAIARTRRA